jgi:hypothetical protein
MTSTDNLPTCWLCPECGAQINGAADWPEFHYAMRADHRCDGVMERATILPPSMTDEQRLAILSGPMNLEVTEVTKGLSHYFFQDGLVVRPRSAATDA